MTGKRSTFDTAPGSVHLQRAPGRTRAYGHEVFQRLSDEMVTPDGELVRAMNLAVLRDILPPAASSLDQSSFGWRWPGLRQWLGDAYRLVVDETPLADRPLIIRSGEPFG